MNFFSFEALNSLENWTILKNESKRMETRNESYAWFICESSNIFAGKDQAKLRGFGPAIWWKVSKKFSENVKKKVCVTFANIFSVIGFVLSIWTQQISWFTFFFQITFQIGHEFRLSSIFESINSTQRNREKHKHSQYAFEFNLFDIQKTRLQWFYWNINFLSDLFHLRIK